MTNLERQLSARLRRLDLLQRMRAQQLRAVIYLAPGDLNDMAVATSTFEWHSGFVEGGPKPNDAAH